MMADSAMSHKVMINTLTQLGITRMRNCCRQISTTERAGILSLLMLKMRDSGHSEAVRRNVLDACLAGYCKMVETEDKGGARVNRPGSEGRKKRKLIGY